MTTGCTGDSDKKTGGESDTNIVRTADLSQPIAAVNDAKPDSNVVQECPEGYVYDYQVSMEPIPEDIAELGGPCQGSIHAFPSKIAMALTELEMEKDPELKAEVEKRIPEITAALEEEIGGDFVVDGVIVESDSAWTFICTEVDTGYQFELNYTNFEYDAQKNGGGAPENAYTMQFYYDQLESAAIQEELLPILREVYGDGDVRVRSQLDASFIDIAIAQYTEKEVDKCEEQKKLIKLWEALQAYDSTVYYTVCLTFYRPEYQSVIKEKYDAMLVYEIGSEFNQEVALCLAENGDIWCNLEYAEYIDEEDPNNLDVLLQQYQTGEYQEDVIWDYWIP